MEVGLPKVSMETRERQQFIGNENVSGISISECGAIMEFRLCQSIHLGVKCSLNDRVCASTDATLARRAMFVMGSEVFK